MRINESLANMKGICNTSVFGDFAQISIEIDK